MSAADPRGILSAYYSGIAEDYVRHWSPLLQPLGESLVRAMPLGGARVIADVGTGTGGLLPLLREHAPGALTVGVDRAAGMLRAAGTHGEGSSLCVMDAQDLALCSESVDAALLAFVLFHCPDPVRALREVRRVLRPAGVAGIATWGEDDVPDADIWREELDACGAKEGELPETVRRHDLMDDEAKLRALVDQAGLVPERLWVRCFQHAWAVQDLVATRGRCGVVARRLWSLSGPDRRRCLDRVRKRLSSCAARDLVQGMRTVFALVRHPGGR